MNDSGKEPTVADDDAVADTQHAAHLAVLRNAAAHDWVTVHRSLLKVYRDARRGDEPAVLPLVHYPESMVASAALYAGVEVYRRWEELKPIAERFALGDERDDTEMPVQSTAIWLISRHDRSAPAVARLLAIADDPAQPELVVVDVWRALALAYGVEWTAEDLERMAWEPDHPACRAKRAEIRAAVAEAFPELRSSPEP